MIRCDRERPVNLCDSLHASGEGCLAVAALQGYADAQDELGGM
jgi:hypothetical protein